MREHFINKKTELKIYLKNKKLPLSIILDTNEQKEEIIRQIFSNDTIKIGPVLFLKENLNYIIFE